MGNRKLTIFAALIFIAGAILAVSQIINDGSGASTGHGYNLTGGPAAIPSAELSDPASGFTLGARVGGFFAHAGIATNSIEGWAAYE